MAGAASSKAPPVRNRQENDPSGLTTYRMPPARKQIRPSARMAGVDSTTEGTVTAHFVVPSGFRARSWRPKVPW